MRVKTTRSVAGALVVLGAGIYVLFGRGSSPSGYYLTVGELRARGEAAFDTAVRVGGQVAPGSISWDRETGTLRFLLVTDRDSAEVVYRGLPPDNFRDSRGVVVEGSYRKPGVIEANTILTKCPSKYKP